MNVIQPATCLKNMLCLLLHLFIQSDCWGCWVQNTLTYDLYSLAHINICDGFALACLALWHFLSQPSYFVTYSMDRSEELKEWANHSKLHITHELKCFVNILRILVSISFSLSIPFCVQLKNGAYTHKHTHTRHSSTFGAYWKMVHYSYHKYECTMHWLVSHIRFCEAEKKCNTGAMCMCVCVCVTECVHECNAYICWPNE